MKKRLLFSTFLLLFFINSNSQINLVKDIVPGSNNSDPIRLTDVNGTLFFYPSLVSSATFPELWKTDGTFAGTTLVKVLPEATQGTNSDISFKGSLYMFRGNSGFWKSDGTAAGTILLKTFYSIGMKSIVYKNNLYFYASSIAGDGLYKSDGTAAGTVFVKSAVFQNPVISGDYIYFEGSDPINSNELWKTDGTAAGTVMVKNINPTGAGNPQYLLDLNGLLIFQGTDGVNGWELWKSDGTEAGTVMLKNISAGAGSTETTERVNVNGVLYFVTKLYGGLWKSDGTEAGTVLVKNYFPNIYNLTNVNGTLLFSAEGGNSGLELWKTNGTEAGTIMVKDVRPGYASSGMLECTAIGSTMYFSALSDTYGRELWKTDGTEAGTVLVQDRNAGAAAFTPRKLTVSGSKLYMTGTTAVEGMELFVYENSTSNLLKNTIANEVSIYPNPSNGDFTVEMKENVTNCSLSIYNLMGKNVLNQPISASKTTIYSKLETGIYYVKICDSNNNNIQLNKVLIE